MIERDDELCGALIDQCRAFWASVQTGVMPPLDDTVATLAAVRVQHPDIDRERDVDLGDDPDDLADEWLSSKAALADADRWHTGATSALLAAMGNARRVTAHGQVIARRQPHASGSVALVRVAALPDISTGDAA